MIWTSTMEPVLVDDTTIGAAIVQAAKAHPDRMALVDGPSGKAVTYRELARRIDRIAAWLSSDGLGPGDRIAVWAPNVPPVAACTLAAMSVGAAVTGVNPAWSDGEVAAQLGDVGASMLVTMPDLADRAGSFGLRRVIVLGEATGQVSLAALLACGGDAPSRAATRWP